jgi:peptidoglycan hydrolase-like protein with peptidoglycan-binding domain
MATGKQLLALAVPHIGEKYVFGVVVPKNDKDYDGPWDCAEFTSWLVYQLTGRLYGCARNDGDPATADAYSGFWGDDAYKRGTKISVNDAIKTPGAVLLRIAGKGLIGHVVVSNGKGGTVEAHSTKTGVIASTVGSRRWDFGILVPWIDYDQTTEPMPVIQPAPKIIYRWKVPMMFGNKIKEIQTRLGLKSDGWYGPRTHNAVRNFQIKSNLVADGEVGPLTAAKLGLTL